MRPRLLPVLLLVLSAPALAEEPSPSPAPAADAAAAPAPAPSVEPAPVAVPVPPPPPAPSSEAPAAQGSGITTFKAERDLEAPPAPAAPAEAPPPPAAPAEAAVAAPPPPPPLEAPLPKYALRLGLGLPDGLGASLVFRPVPFLRLQAGPAWNYLSFGLQGGVTVTPLRWAVSPVLEASYGHFFGADLKKTVKNMPTEVEQLASDVGYDYFAGHLGLEFGSPRGYTFSLGVGLAYLWTTLHGTASVVKNQGTPDEATVTVTNPSVRAVIPSLRLGMLYYF